MESEKPISGSNDNAPVENSGSEPLKVVAVDVKENNEVYRNPNKGKAGWLSFEYLLAMGSAIGASLLIVDILIALFGGWSGSEAAVQNHVAGMMGFLLSLDMVTDSTGLITASVMSILLGLLSFIFFARVSKKIPERPGYTARTIYKIVTYGGFGVLLIASLTLAAKLIGVLISSLALIGVNNAGAVYKSLYIAEFLPYLIGLGLLVVMLWLMRKIILGSNKSRLMSIIVLGAAGAVLLASVVTVTLQVNRDGVNRNDQQQMIDDYYGPDIFDFPM